MAGCLPCLETASTYEYFVLQLGKGIGNKTQYPEKNPNGLPVPRRDPNLWPLNAIVKRTVLTATPSAAHTDW